MGSTSSSPSCYDDYYFGLDSYDSLDFYLTELSYEYVVHNCGRMSITLKVFEMLNTSLLTIRTILPGEKRGFVEKEFRSIAVVTLINSSNARAIGYVRGRNLRFPVLSNSGEELDLMLDIGLIVLQCFAPPILTCSVLVFQLLFKTFWPESKPNIWNQISGKIYDLLDANNRAIIVAILENEIEVYREKLKSLISELEANITVNDHYMALAYDLIGLERKFQFSNTIGNHERLNLVLLPLMSCVLALKMNFYFIGIKFSKEIGLTKNNIFQIKNYALVTYENAAFYIGNLEKGPIENVYNNADPKDMFNKMMSIRNYLAKHGQEYLPIWKHQLENPLGKGQIYNPVMIYSTFFGEKTPDLYAQATAEEVPPPLCPKLVNGRRSELQVIEIFLGGNLIFGAKLYFGNGDEYTMGTKTSSNVIIYLEGSKIIQIIAFGDGKIDGLIFSFSDQTEVTIGQITSHRALKFSYKNHYISSFYLSSDSDELGGQAANIAVSFQWYMTPEEC